MSSAFLLPFAANLSIPPLVTHPLFVLVWKTTSYKIDPFILLSSSSCHPQINFLKLHHDTSTLTPVAFHCLQKSLDVIAYDHDPLPPYIFLVNFPHHPSTVCILGLKNCTYFLLILICPPPPFCDESQLLLQIFFINPFLSPYFQMEVSLLANIVSFLMSITALS